MSKTHRFTRGGEYPGNPDVIKRLQKGEAVEPEEIAPVRFEAGELVDPAALDPAIRKSLELNGLLEPAQEPEAKPRRKRPSVS